MGYKTMPPFVRAHESQKRPRNFANYKQQSLLLKNPCHVSKFYYAGRPHLYQGLLESKSKIEFFLLNARFKPSQATASVLVFRSVELTSLLSAITVVVGFGAVHFTFVGDCGGGGVCIMVPHLLLFVNSQNGMTAIHVAALFGQTEVIQEFLTRAPKSAYLVSEVSKLLCT